MLLYALAWAGGAVAYVPLLTVLLPGRVSLVAGNDAVDWLAYVSFVGAIGASIANIGFGWLSDILKNRNSVALVGWFVSSALLLSFGSIERLSTLLMVIGFWQLSLNMMLSPLAAWAGDCVPDHQKGQLGGLLAIAPATGALAGAFVTLPGLAAEQERLWLLVLIISVLVLPALLLGRPRHFPELMADASSARASAERRPKVNSIVMRMWIARLLIQITEIALITYLFLWLRSLSDTVSQSMTALTYSIVLLVGIPVALLAGRWADSSNKPIVPLMASAALVSLGLLIMAASRTIAFALTGYFIFGVAGAVFLALHSAQTLRVLPRPTRRGRDLGIFNLTNTLPSIIMPGLTLAMVPYFGFAGLFFLLAALCAIAFTILLTAPRAA